METLETQSNHALAKIIDPQQKIATEISVRFPATSSSRKKYLFVLYYYGSNSILVRPMKNITDK